MRKNILHASITTLIACAFMAMNPLPASADQQRVQGRDRQQEHQTGLHKQHQTRTTPSRQINQRTAQRPARQKPIQRRPAVNQQRRTTPTVQQRRTAPTVQQRRPAPSVQQRRVETHRSIHIRPPQNTTSHHAWRPVARRRFYRGLRVYRPYGLRYPGFGFYYDDHDAFRWLALTALAMAIITHLDEHQQRLYEQAFIQATSAYAGDTIYWQEGYSHGSIAVLAIWYDHRGRQCRNLEQTVTAAGLTQIRRDTVCLQPSGAWVVGR